ncbi:antitermination protein Q [Salmonella enterica subsp. enterica serovar Derby]|nr:antitermination protein Q [Salmonella enterica subsp. enterica serovar Derby]
MKKGPGFMARLFIRFVGVAMETGLAVYQPHWRGIMSRSWYRI